MDKLDAELISYKTVKETSDSLIKKTNWDTAIGLQKVDNLKPSKYLLKLAKGNITGKIKTRDIEPELKKYYDTQKQHNMENSDERECDLVSARIVEILSHNNFSFRPTSLKVIHEYLFKDIYDFAGKYRTYNITKAEPILGNDTVIYASYNEINSTLDYDFKEEMKHDYSKLSLDEQVDHLMDFTSRIWQVHPFGEGNTRTVAVLIKKYLRSLGYGINNDLFKEHSLYFRNALVRSNYSNREKNIYPTNKYLLYFFENLLNGGNHKLDNNDLYIDNLDM